ncbi:DNA-binding transcriptional regulator, MarR family [Variovorax sp. 770b2]|nr:DNA-binding transcriptional regulator, MarR family [Variovorax sp. 770b2]
MPAKKISATSKSALPFTASHASLLVGGTDQTLRRVTLGLAVLGWVLADIRAGFGKLVHVSPFQYVALQAIARVTTDDPWTTQSVARHFRVTKAFVSMELKPLIAKDLIRADPTANDKRSKIFSLTEHGTHALVALAPVQQKINDLLYSQFDSAGLVQLGETIERMLTDAEQASEYLKQLLASRKFEIE